MKLLQTVIAEDVRSTCDRTYFVILVRSADLTDYRCDRQTDKATNHQQLRLKGVD